MNKNNNFANTVFVLGAGSSCHLGYPLGEELFFDIIKRFNPPVEFRYNPNDVHLFKEALHNSHSPSVDAFLEKAESFKNDWVHYLDMGRVAIAQHLLKKESSDLLGASDDNLRDKNWYRYFWKKIHRNPQKLVKGDIAFITFNYDLSLEEFLYRSIKYNLYGHSLTKEQKVELNKSVQKIPIIHVYGQLGFLRWQSTEGQKRDYGKDTNKYILEASKQIKIIRENDKVTPEFQKAQKLINNARRIYFLGFGYDSVNLERLGIYSSIHRQKIEGVFGTTIGLGNAAYKRVHNSFHGDIRSKVKLDRKERKIVEVLKDDLEVI